MSRKCYFSLLVIAYFLFLIRSHLLLDPDFGWHLKSGEHILTIGIPYLDLFSYTMPSFPWVAHEWIVDILWALLYPKLGLFGLAVIWAVFPVFFLALFTSSNRRFSFIPLFLSIFTLLSFVGIRAQPLSWVWFALLMKLIFAKNWRKNIYFTPMIFLFWANTHASFPIGIVALAIVLILRFLKARKILFSETFIFLMCLVGTFINPYGAGMWEEAITTFFDPTTRWFIQEWQPLVFFPLMPVILYLVLYFVFLVHYWKKFSIEQKVLGLVFSISALSSARNVPFWLVFAFPVVSNGILYFYTKARDYPQGSDRFKRASVYAIVIVLLVSLYHLRLVYNGSAKIRENSFYPNKAVEYIRQNNLEGRLFSTYSWGGYLIWKLPEKKVFIDGRMTAWRLEHASTSELEAAVKDYIKITSQKADINEYANRFDISLVLWPKSQVLRQPLDDVITFFIPQHKEVPEQIFLRYLESKGWQEIYEDELAVIYQNSIQ